jgi:hypothetical protein
LLLLFSSSFIRFVVVFIVTQCHKAGSLLDPSPGTNAGPYGSGQVAKHQAQAQQPRPQWKRRQTKRLAREGEILRYWVQASIACTQAGVFTNESAEAAIAARVVIAASASIRPSLKHIAQRIRDADDRGANRIFAPVMKMAEGVLKKITREALESIADYTFSTLRADAARKSSLATIPSSSSLLLSFEW